MKVIDGSGIVMGRLASYVAKELLRGEEIAVVNCSEVIITGNKKTLEKEFQEERSKFGSSQKGPKHHRTSEKIVKRTIRGMLPNHRMGRGKIAFRRVKCYNLLPKEFEDKKFTKLEQTKKIKINRVKELTKKYGN